MKYFLFLFLPSMALALTPFDKLSKDNATVTVQMISGGGTTQNDYRTDWGSYDKTTTQTKKMEVSARVKSPATVIFVFVFKDQKGEFMVQCAPAKVKDEKPILFSQSAESRDLKLAAIGERYKTGDKIYGWFVRIVMDEKVIGAAGSNERFRKFAESGSDIPKETGND